MTTITLNNNSTAINNVFLTPSSEDPTKLVFEDGLWLGEEIYTSETFSPSLVATENLTKSLSFLMLAAVSNWSVVTNPETNAPIFQTEGSTRFYKLQDETGFVSAYVALAAAPTVSSLLVTATEIYIDLGDGQDWVSAKGSISIKLVSTPEQSGGIQLNSTLSSIRGPESNNDGDIELKGSMTLASSGWSGSINSGVITNYNQDIETPDGYVLLEYINTITLASPVTFSLPNEGVINFSGDPAIISYKNILTQITGTFTATGVTEQAVEIFTQNFSDIVGLKFSTQLDQSISSFLLSGNDNITVTQTGIPKSAWRNDINASSGNDTITGSASADELSGGSGNDSIVGGDGNDIIFNESGNDTLSGGNGDDKFYADGGIFGNPIGMQSIERDSIDGGAGNDKLDINFNQADISIAKIDASTFEITSKDASYSALVKGIETISFSDGEMALNGVLPPNIFTEAANTISDLSYVNGGGGNDIITGTDDNDVLLGSDGADKLTGGAGNDYLDGGSGIDTMNGGEGDDFYVVDSASDVIQETNTGFNAVRVKGDTSFTLAAGQSVTSIIAAEYAPLAFIFNDQNLDKVNIKGNEFDQSIEGNAAANKLEGLGGDDYIWGNKGNDTLDGGAGNDELSGGAGDDLLFGGDGTDRLYGDEGDLNFLTSLAGSAGKDTLDGGAGNDDVAVMMYDEGNYLLSKSGTDLILTNRTDISSVTTIKANVEFVSFNGMSGGDANILTTDLLAGAASIGNDLLYQRTSGSYDAASKTFKPVAEFVGSVIIDGLAGNDTIYGSNAAFTYAGGFDAGDRLSGGDGSDSLVGLAGSDYLDGGAGSDTMNGGEGSDLYVVDAATDVIQGESGIELATTLDYKSTNALQVKGDTSYVLADGVAIGFLTAGAFMEDAYLRGDETVYDFSTTNKTNIKGNSYGQLITGNAAANKLEGAGGDDSVWGATGNDTLDGGTGNDTLDGGIGDDLVAGGVGNDFLYGDFGLYSDATSTYGFGGKDTLDGGADTDGVFMQYSEGQYSLSKSGTDLILTNKENAGSITTIKNTVEFIGFADSTEPMALADLMAGAASSGNDLVYQRGSGSFDSTTKIFTPNAEFASGVMIDGLAGNDTIYGSEFAGQNSAGRDVGDMLLGGDGADSLVGFGGADILDGGSGNDTLVGGAGSDLYIVDAVGDVIQGETLLNSVSPGDYLENVIQVKGDISYVLGADVAVGYLSAGIFDSKLMDQADAYPWTYSNLNKANIKGNDFAQTIDGNAAANKLEGMGGNDYLWGASGNDTLDGGVGDDTLNGGIGDDLVAGGAGNDLLFGDFGNLNDTMSTNFFGGKDTLDGGVGSDTVFMQYNEGQYTLSKAGSDLILTNKAIAGSITTLKNTVEFIRFADSTEPMALADLLAGAASSGNDVLYRRGSGSYTDSSKTFTINADYSGDGFTMTGLAGNDSLFGTVKNDALQGDAGNDSLTGFAGNDTLDGGAGNDTLAGGAGNDRYLVDSVGDIIVDGVADDPAQQAFSVGNDNDVVIASVTYTLNSGADVEDLIAVGSLTGNTNLDNTVINLTGNELSQGLMGNSAANKLDGAGGDDALIGGAGADTLLGGAGNDLLLGGVGNDNLDGGLGNDFLGFDWTPLPGYDLNNQQITLVATGGTDTINGGEGTDTLMLMGDESQYTFTRSSANEIRATAKSGEVALLTSVEQVLFNVVPDTLDINSIPATISIGALLGSSDFDDVLSSRLGTAAFNVKAGKGNDLVTGTSFAETIDGGEGNDTLIGGGGSDTLLGGLGNDQLAVSWRTAPERDAPASLVQMDGGAGDDIYVIDGGSMNRSVSITDAAGIDTLRINFYPWSTDYNIFIDGSSKTLTAYASMDTEEGLAVSPGPVLSFAAGTIERIEGSWYDNPNNIGQLTDSQSYGVVYATLDAKLNTWTAKGSDKADIFFATTGGANLYDGGKGDDFINVLAHAGTVVQGGEGFNEINVFDGVPGTSSARSTPEVPMGTLSYAWSTGGVEVNMEAGVGIAYDAKGEEMLGVDQFYGLANVLGSKLNDTLIGDSFNNQLDGSDGNDTLAGGGGSDLLVGGAGNDTYVVNLKAGRVVASERLMPASLSANGALQLDGGTDAKGTDTLMLSGFTQLGDLRFSIGDKSVQIGVAQADAETGAETISYNLLADRGIEQIGFDTGAGTPAVYATTWGNLGTKGSDLVMTKAAGGYALGGLGDDLLLGGQGRDLLLGGAGNDILRGGGSSDRLLGGAGNDVILLNAGDGDIALGGSGADSFVINGQSDNSQGMVSRVLDFRLNEDYLRFDGVQGVRIRLANGLSETQGMTGDGSRVVDLTLNDAGYLSATGTEDGPMALMQVQVVSLIGVDTQAELQAVMERVAFG